MWWSSNIPKHLPLATGPFTPGCIDVMTEYSKDGFFVRLFYPTEVKKDTNENYKKWVKWLPDDSYLIGIKNVLMTFTFLVRLAFWWSDNVHIPVIYGAKPKTDEKLKCIIFSHGLGGSRFLCSSICYEMASHGFLVASVEHRDSSACHSYFYASKDDVKNDKKTKIDYKVIKLGKQHYTRRNEQVNYRANECSNILDFLIKLNNGEIGYNVLDDLNEKYDFNLKDLVGNLDVNNMTVSGHSFGGATALLTLSKRTELKQGILLDPWMFPVKGEDLVEKVEQPLLFINTQTFHIATNVKAMSSLLTGEHRKMYTILHSTHENQTDTVFIFGYWLNWFMKKINPLTAININNSLMLTFLNQQINFPTSDMDRINNYLEEHKSEIDAGLTKPWA